MQDKTQGAVGKVLLFESNSCRVWQLDLEPEQATSWHEHSCDYVYVVTRAGSACTELLNGARECQDDQVGDSRYRTPDGGHRLVNIGSTTYENIIVELKETRRTS